MRDIDANNTVPHFSSTTNTNNTRKNVRIYHRNKALKDGVDLTLANAFV